MIFYTENILTMNRNQIIRRRLHQHYNHLLYDKTIIIYFRVYTNHFFSHKQRQIWRLLIFFLIILIWSIFLISSIIGTIIGKKRSFKNDSFWVFKTIGFWVFKTISFWVFKTIGFWVFKTISFWVFKTISFWLVLALYFPLG